MDLEDLFGGGHRRKHGHHDKHGDRYDEHGSHDHRAHSHSHPENEHGYRGEPFHEHYPSRRHHGEHDALRALTHIAANVPHLKWVVAVLAVGLVAVLIVGGALAVMLFPVVGRALGFVHQNGVQGTIESVIPPGGVKGAIESVVPPGGVKGVVESVVPVTGLKGTVDSTVGLMQRIWYGKPTEPPLKEIPAAK